MQKFIRGNMAKIVDGYQDEVNRFVVITEPSHYTNDDRLAWEYEVIFLDKGNTRAWIPENQLEFVDEGGEYLIEKAKQIREESRRRNSDLNYIVKNWSKLQTEGMSSDTALFIFAKIGFTSSFRFNGEYSVLWNDWDTIFPYLDKFVTTDGVKDEVINEVNTSMTKTYREKMIALYKEIQDVKKAA